MSSPKEATSKLHRMIIRPHCTERSLRDHGRTLAPNRKAIVPTSFPADHQRIFFRQVRASTIRPEHGLRRSGNHTIQQALGPHHRSSLILPSPRVIPTHTFYDFRAFQLFNPRKTEPTALGIFPFQTRNPSIRQRRNQWGHHVPHARSKYLRAARITRGDNHNTASIFGKAINAKAVSTRLTTIRAVQTDPTKRVAR